MKPEMKQVVNLTKNKVVTSSFKGQIPACSILFKNSRYAYVFNYVHSASLVSLGQFCDYGYTAVIDENEFMLSNVLI